MKRCDFQDAIDGGATRMHRPQHGVDCREMAHSVK
jgi:hypothetical protein